MTENTKKMPETVAEIAIDEIERSLRYTKKTLKAQFQRLKEELPGLERIIDGDEWDSATAEHWGDGQVSALATDIAGLIMKAKALTEAVTVIKVAVEWREEQDAKVAAKLSPSEADLDYYYSKAYGF
jgi:hypothetical protein